MSIQGNINQLLTLSAAGAAYGNKMAKDTFTNEYNKEYGSVEDFQNTTKSIINTYNDATKKDFVDKGATNKDLLTLAEKTKATMSTLERADKNILSDMTDTYDKGTKSGIIGMQKTKFNTKAAILDSTKNSISTMDELKKTNSKMNKSIQARQKAMQSMQDSGNGQLTSREWFNKVKTGEI